MGDLAGRLATEEALSKETIEEVERLAVNLDGTVPDSSPKYIQGLSQALSALAAEERGPEPGTLAVRRLKARLPEILFFDAESRDLKSVYHLFDVAEDVPPALSNFAAIAKLDLQRLRSAVSEADQALVNTIQHAANRELNRVFQASWRQSELSVHVRTDGQTLHVQVLDRMQEFSDLDERSDGLRQFVALMAFCQRNRGSRPILLLDEAETHLHLDAQADLVDMLAGQEVAAQVVYSTHSLGCLPEDLGGGVRLIRQADAARSEISNKFWVGNEPGFSALLFGMGATTMAFLPVRAAALVEGPSDHILLPRILTEAGGSEYLGFQVVPGLAEASRAQVPALAAHGSTVVYVTDNDEGGLKLRNWLSGEAGIDRSRVLSLAGARSTLRTVEDFLDPGLLADAVNRYLARWNEPAELLQGSRLPNSDRVKHIERFCRSQGLTAAPKVEIAYEVVDLLNEEPARPVTCQKRLASARALLKAIRGRLRAS